MAAAAAGALLFAGGVGLGRSQVPAESASGEAMAAVVAVASAPDAHVLPVDIMGTTSRVVISQEMDKAVFLAADLPMPAKGMCYQVWRVAEDGTMESAGVAVPAADGHLAVVLDGGAQDVTKFMITMEPPGGSDHPSGDMLAEVRT
jgi:anti-sigma-K factor RskA